MFEVVVYVVDIVVPDTLRVLVQAGSPCELIVDPANHKHVCIANTPVELGSLYSRW